MNNLEALIALVLLVASGIYIIQSAMKMSNNTLKYLIISVTSFAVWIIGKFLFQIIVSRTY